MGIGPPSVERRTATELRRADLKQRRIAYMHFSEEFGARHNDPDLLDDDGEVDFEKVRKSWNFKQGVERLWSGLDITTFTLNWLPALCMPGTTPFIPHRSSRHQRSF